MRIRRKRKESSDGSITAKETAAIAAPQKDEIRKKKAFQWLFAVIIWLLSAGLAVASMKGKSYLSLGGVSMGIAGSIVDHNFFESWLGMKVQAVDMTELRRRIDQKIYDEAELEMALAWADKNFRYGEDENNKQYQRNAEQSRAVLREYLECLRGLFIISNDMGDCSHPA